MREISSETITAAVERLCIEAATILPPSLAILLECAAESEESPKGVSELEGIVENYRSAAMSKLPICGNTDMTIVFADIGQDVHITGGLFEDAVNEGMRLCADTYGTQDPARGRAEHMWAALSLSDMPSVLHVRMVEGDKIGIHVVPRCFRSETMSALRMFMPDDSSGMIEDFIVDTVSKAGSNACPPIVVGVGLGGAVEQCAIAAKRALFRSPDKRNTDEFYANMERRVLAGINRLGIGPKGVGGRFTAVAVNIEAYHMRTVGLPCVVTLGCNSTRHAYKEI